MLGFGKILVHACGRGKVPFNVTAPSTSRPNALIRDFMRQALHACKPLFQIPQLRPGLFGQFETLGCALKLPPITLTVFGMRRRL
jgi:hypothetical protein